MNMRKIIITYALLVLFLNSHASDSTQLKLKNKISFSLGGSFSIIPRLFKNTIVLGSAQKYLDRDLTFHFDYSSHLQLAFARLITKNLYAGIQYNHALGIYTQLDGQKYNYEEYSQISIGLPVQGKYRYKYETNIINLVLQYKLEEKVNKTDHVYIMPSAGYGFGWMNHLQQTGIEYDNLKINNSIYGANDYTKRYEYIADISHANFHGLNAAIEIGYSFKKIDIGLNLNYNRIAYPKVNKYGTIESKKLYQNYIWSMLSASFNF
jgi:hypothetical protein